MAPFNTVHVSLSNNDGFIMTALLQGGELLWIYCNWGTEV